MEFNLWALIQWATLFLLGTGVITTIFTQRHITNREIDSRQFQDKRSTYLEFVNFLSRRMHGDQKIDVDKEMQKFRTLLTVWGDAWTINTFEFFVALNNGPHEEVDAFLRVDLLLRSLRRELGHDDRNLPLGTLALMQIKPDEKKDELLEKIQHRSQTKAYKQRLKKL